MPRNLGELGEMFSHEEVRELRQGDQTEIQKLRHDKKMLEEKIFRLKKLSQPFLSEMFNVQSEQIPPGNCSLHWALVLSAWVELLEINGF